MIVQIGHVPYFKCTCDAKSWQGAEGMVSESHAQHDSFRDDGTILLLRDARSSGYEKKVGSVAALKYLRADPIMQNLL